MGFNGARWVSIGFNGAGVWVYATSGVPFVSGTVISSTVMNNLDTEIGTGFSTCIARDGQSVTSARISFLFGIASTLTTDSSSIGTGSITTLGGIGCTKALWVGGLANIAGAVTLQSTLAVTGAVTLTAGISATLFTSTSAGVFLGGATATDVLLTKSGANLIVSQGDSLADAGVRAAIFNATSSVIYIGGTGATEVSLRRSTTQLKVRLGNDSNDADLSCGVLTATTANATTVATTNLTATGTIDLGGQDYSGLLAGITNITIVKGVVTFTS